MDPPNTLLTKLERTSPESPVMLALVLDEAPNWISLVKNPHWFIGSLLNPLLLYGSMVYGFSGPDTQNLAAVHVPVSAFETTTAYNMLDEPVTVQAGLKALLADQAFHPYVNIGIPHMLSLACKCAILLLVKWHMSLACNYPFSVSMKAFYDMFLAPLGLAKAQPYSDIFTWWRHAAMHAALAGTQACLGLQVSTTQLLSPKLHGAHDGWAHKQAKKIIMPLHTVTLPLSSVAFQMGMDQLHSDLATQHATHEAQELAQHANREAREDHHDAMQTIKG